MSISVRPALATDRSTVRALLDSYLRELSAYGEVDPAYPWFDAYWQAEEARWPYVIEDGHRSTIGFALVNTHAPAGLPAEYAMAEFYIAPSARRSGSGVEAAVLTFRCHPGIWALAIMGGNRAALSFWPAAIAAAGAREIEQAIIEGGIAYRFGIGSVL